MCAELAAEKLESEMTSNSQTEDSVNAVSFDRQEVKQEPDKQNGYRKQTKTKKGGMLFALCTFLCSAIALACIAGVFLGIYMLYIAPVFAVGGFVFMFLSRRQGKRALATLGGILCILAILVFTTICCLLGLIGNIFTAF